MRWTFVSPSPPAAGWSLPLNGYGARKNKSNVCYDDAYRVIAVGDACYFCSSAENRLLAVNAQNGRLLWTYFTNASPRLAPTYWQGRLCFGADDGIFRCMDATTGSRLWEIDAAPSKEMILGYGRFHAKRPIRAASAVVDGVIYFSAGLFPQHGVELYAVRAKDGTVLWRQRLDRSGASNVIPQGPILVDQDSVWLTSRIAPARFDRSDGHPIRFSTPFPDIPNSHEYRYYNGGTEAQLHRNHIVFGSACKLAFDPSATWKDRWGKPQRGQLDYAWFNARQMRFHDGMAYVATDNYVCAVAEEDLAAVAEKDCRRFEQTYKRLQIAHYLDLLDRRDQMAKELGPEHVDVKALEEGPLKWGRDSWNQWQELLPDLIANIQAKCRWLIRDRATEAMIVAGDVIVVGGDEQVSAFEAATGKRRWSFPTGCRVRSLAAANGRLYVSTTDGAVRCFESGASEIVSTPISNDDGSGPVEQEAIVGDETAATTLRCLKQSPEVLQRKGYCLLTDCEDLSLAIQLARLSNLHIVVLEQDDARVERWRRTLVQKRLYGTRVVVHPSSKEVLPYPPYLFDVVIDRHMSLRDRGTDQLKQRLRATKPCGGLALLTFREDAEESGRVVRQCADRNDEVTANGTCIQVRRGRLPDTRDWTHNYATTANTYCSEDRQVRGPFDVLWYGEPGPRDRIDRHATPPMPLVVGSTLFTLGPGEVMAYDIYNGACRWRRPLRGAQRTHLPIDTSNLAADSSSLFVVIENGECLRLDADDGKTIQTYSLPEKHQKAANRWAWIARSGNHLFGSRAEVSPTGRKTLQQTSDVVFALDVATGTSRWLYRGSGIDHDGIAVANDHVFLIDRTLDEGERQQALASVKPDSSVPDRQARDRRGNPIGPDLRKIVVLDARRGQVRWERPWNFSDVTLDDRVVQDRSAVACMVAHGVLVVHGTGSLGHPHREFLAGEFDRRALYAFDVEEGRYLWGGRRGYRKRPIIIGDRVYAEPFAWDLHSGQAVTVPNPISGELQPLDFHRGYIGCGHLLASGASLFGAKNGIAYCNLGDLSGFSPFSGLALACGLDAVPAGGVFVVPEGRSGCTCDTPIHTSISLYPQRNAESWGIGFTGGRSEVQSLPVKHVSINLGAPGFRQDADGNLWIPYPRRVDTGVFGDWLPKYQHSDEMCYRVHDESLAIGGDLNWVYRSGYTHEKPLVFTMQEEECEQVPYTVKLHFAEPEELNVGDRIFTVFIQDREVATDVDLSKLAKRNQPLVLTSEGVIVGRDLTIRLVKSEKSTKPPLLCGLQAIREDNRNERDPR